jgi:aminopeptidase N
MQRNPIPPIHLIFICLLTFLGSMTTPEVRAQSKSFSRADSLRGSLNAERSWWDVTHYAITVAPEFSTRRIAGTVKITFRVTGMGNRMQIDLQEPMNIDGIVWKGRALSFSREGNAWHVDFPESLPAGSLESIFIAFSGKPVVAKRPPWDGGWIFTTDAKGRPWMSVACQGLGASVWYPCKDHQSDEPDSASLAIMVPDSLKAVGNGRLRSVVASGKGYTTYQWAVSSPINSYNIIPYIGAYASWQETLSGEAGALDATYHVLDYNLDKAKTQFVQARDMMRCFEHWFGPYPFRADGFQLVEAPHLGMEHQSAVAYGNGYQNGYRGRDLSGSGWGLKWDFILVHESGHEWFGNNITTKDIADMWVHEGFTNYSETIFTECQSGKQAGSEYVRGTRKLIRNDMPIIGPYGVNTEGSGDMYYKGGNMIHYMRQLFRDEERFRAALRGMNETFRHRTVTHEEVATFWSTQLGRDITPLFDQYLKTTKIPVLTWRIKDRHLYYRWTDCIDGYNIPVKINIKSGDDIWLEPSTKEQHIRLPKGVSEISLHPDFYAKISRD